jgi:Ca-activated chloride channel family protein
MLILVLVMLMSIIALSAFSVDVAYMQMVRTQLRASTDAAAKAAGEALAREQSGDAAIRAAQKSASRNPVAGRNIRLQPEDIILGRTAANRDGSWAFKAGSTPFNAVRVNSVMSSKTRPGGVKLLFAHLVGSSTFSPSETATVANLENEVVLSVDRSHSMCFDLTGRDWSYAPNNPLRNRRYRGWMQDYYAPPHPTGSLWASLEIAVNDFLDVAENANEPPKVSLVTWGSGLFDRRATPSRWKSVVRETPLDKQYSRMRNAISQKSRKMMLGGTNLSAGIDAARKVLLASRSMANRTIILMTDGQWNSGRQPRDAARDCQRAGITVHTVTFLPRSDQRTMQQVARTTGGRHFHATSQAELQAVFQELARSLPIILIE